MTKKMKMKTSRIGFQNLPTFYNALHLFSHTLKLFRTVLGGLLFKFSLQEFQTINWIKFFISFRHFNFLHSLLLWLENVSSSTPRTISLRTITFGSNIPLTHDLLFLTTTNATKFFIFLMTNLDTEEYMAQQRPFHYDFGGLLIFQTSNIMSRPAINVKSALRTSYTFLSQFQPLRHYSYQSYPMTSTKLPTNSYIHDYRTRRHSNDIFNEDSGTANTSQAILYSYGIQELRRSWIGRRNHTILDHSK